MDEVIFAQRISEAIKHSGFTQKEIAVQLGLSEGNITNWKTGKNLPSVETLFRLCKILDVSADYLLGLADR